MKNLLLFILFIFVIISTANNVFSQTIYTNGVYVNKEGKTVEITKNIYSVSTTNIPSIIHFSNGLSVKVDTNSEFVINSFFQEAQKYNAPHKAKFGASNFSATLTKGAVVLVFTGDTNNNSSCTISTPFTDHELSDKGIFYIEVGETSSTMVVLEGSLKSYAEKNKGVKTTTAGNAVKAILSDSKILESKVSLYEDKVQKSILDKLNLQAKDIFPIRDNIFFITENGKTFGILIN